MSTATTGPAARHADVLVIGAGVLGTFHAYHAARKGYRTVVVERNAWPNDASTRNFGMIVSTIVPVESPWADYARAGQEIYRALQQDHDIGVQAAGSLYLASTPLECRVLREFAEAWGSAYNCTYMDGREACARYPSVQASYCAGALLFPDDLTIDPRRMLRQLIPRLVAQGLFDYRPLTTIVSLEVCGDHCIARDARGTTISAERVIVCQGAEYRLLFPTLFQQSGLRVCKLQMMETVPLPQRTLPHATLSGLSIRRYPAFASCPSYASLMEEPLDAELATHGIHLLLKQSPQGGVVIGDSHEYSDLDEAASREESTDERITAAILGYGRRMVTLPSWEIARRWNGYYMVYPRDQVFTQTIDGLIHVVTGIGGKGMTTGPGFARHHIETILS